MSKYAVDFQYACAMATRRLKKIALGIGAGLETTDFYMVGGAVRDVLMGEMTGHSTIPKDYDIITPRPLQLHNNHTIYNIHPNSMGGTKLLIKNIGEIDIFQHHTRDIPAIVANYFDFTCNSLYYATATGRLDFSAYFLHFIETSRLNMAVGYDGHPAHIAIRAIKFQIKFATDFGINVRLGDNITNIIASMTPPHDRVAIQYAHAKIPDAQLRNQVIEHYYKFRGIR